MITSRIWKLIPLRDNTIMFSRKVDISSARKIRRLLNLLEAEILGYKNLVGDKLWVTLTMAGIRL